MIDILSSSKIKKHCEKWRKVAITNIFSISHGILDFFFEVVKTWDFTAFEPFTRWQKFCWIESICSKLKVTQKHWICLKEKKRLQEKEKN